MKLASYHVHSEFCDGTTNPETMILSAIEQGMSDIGFTGHSAFPFSSEFHMNIKDFNRYAHEIRRLGEKYKNSINVLLGFEADYIPGITAPDTSIYAQFNPDFLIGSVHYVPATEKKTAGIPWCVDAKASEVYEGLQICFDGNIQKALVAYFSAVREMVRLFNFDIVGHLDLPKKRNKELLLFDETATWYIEEVEKTIQVIAGTEKIVEINTNGLTRGVTDSVYPSNHILSLLYTYNIPVTVNSDAHRPQDLTANYSYAFKTLKKIGFNKMYHFGSNGWEAHQIPDC